MSARDRIADIWDRLRAAFSRGYGVFRVTGKAAVLAFAALPVAAQEVTIAALGDSLTQGFGLVQEEGFVPQLERALTEMGRDVRIINAGVSGDTTAGGLARVGWTLTDDVDALIVTLGGNDLLRGIPPEVSRANLAGILDAAATAEVEVLLIGMQAPGNYGPDYKAAFDAMYPELAAEFGAVYAESFFMGFEAASPGDVPDFMQADGLHPSAEGVAVIVESLVPFVNELIARVPAE